MRLELLEIIFNKKIMNPRTKKFVEIWIVLWTLYFFWYMIFYIYFADNYCWKYSQDVDNYKKINLIKMGDCKNNYFCEINEDSKKMYLWKLYKYQCKKEKVLRYEISYYKNQFNELFNK